MAVMGHEVWWMTYKLELAGGLFVLLLLVLRYLYRVDKRYREQVLDKFLLVEQAEIGSDLSDDLPITYPAESVRIAGFLLIGGMFLVLVLLINTYQQYQNQNYVQAFALLLFVINVIGTYLLGSLKRNRQIETLVNKLRQNILDRDLSHEKLLKAELRLQRQNDSLIKLTAIQHQDNFSLHEFVRNLVAESAMALGVERVSVWLFSEDKKSLVCDSLYQASTMRYRRGQRLSVESLPRYFKMLNEARVLAINDVYQHEATLELAQEYTPSLGIGAMLEATIRLGDEALGVLCHEHVGGNREWSLDEINFAGSLADLLRVAIETSRRKLAETELNYQQKYLETLVRTQTAAIESNAKLSRFLVDKAPVSIIYMNIDLQVMEINPEAERMFGYSREAVLGKNFMDVFTSEETREAHLRMFKRVLAGEKVQGEELRVQCADGSVRELSVSRSMEYDEDGSPLIISIGQDMSQQKALEASLIRAREAAESADRIKSMFVASMSHELRTPLNSIIGFLGVVLHGMSGQLNTTQKDQLNRAYQSARHLLSLITDVIDISKIEAGFLETHVEEFEIDELLLEIEQTTRHLAEERGLALVMEVDSDLSICADRKRVYQVILNLVSNGLKYTEHGSVTVQVSRTESRLKVQVKDTGIGMDAAGVAALFKPFERLQSRLKIKTLGTGLGLYLSQKIATQLLSGMITVQSEPDVGSVFTLDIPLVASNVLIEGRSVLDEAI